MPPKPHNEYRSRQNGVHTHTQPCQLHQQHVTQHPLSPGLEYPCQELALLEQQSTGGPLHLLNHVKVWTGQVETESRYREIFKLIISRANLISD